MIWEAPEGLKVVPPSLETTMPSVAAARFVGGRRRPWRLLSPRPGPRCGRAKKKIVARIRSADTRRVRIVSAVTLLLVLPGSKFMVLGLVDLVFGDAVHLGGFLQVTALIIVLMLARGGVRWVFRRADKSASA